MFISRMTRVMVCVLCVWLLTALVAESTIFNHSPRAALAQFPGTALYDTDSSASGSVPVANSTGNPRTGSAPLMFTHVSLDQDGLLQPGLHSNPAIAQVDSVLDQQSLDNVIENGINWTMQTSDNFPPARYGHAMVYDSLRSVTVLFGGLRSTWFDDTWEWDGTNWTQIFPADKPPRRLAHAMAYDSDRGVTVLFGGWGDGQNYNDTWEWNGEKWTQRYPVNKPGARSYHAMAYDSERKLTVLFGGSIRDTWEWDGQNWSQRFPVNNPVQRSPNPHAAMVYDSGREVAVLLTNHSITPLWEWNGIDWVERKPANKPEPRSGHSMAYDNVRGITVLFGGSYSLDDTWEWDGMGWIERFPENKPMARIYSAMAYDTTRDEIILFGGYRRVDDKSFYFFDTWSYSEILPPDAPVLATINNPDDDGNYLVEWSAVTGATGYTLQEDDNPDFTAPVIRYNGLAIYFTVTGQATGTYYYRVRASNDAGHSAWSNTQAVEVLSQELKQCIYLPLLVNQAP
jgi:hypothetical protein